MIPVVEYFLVQLVVNDTKGWNFWKLAVFAQEIIPFTDSMNEDVSSMRLKVHDDIVVVRHWLWRIESNEQHAPAVRLPCGCPASALRKAQVG
jgi:hypothetical protein